MTVGVRKSCIKALTKICYSFIAIFDPFVGPKLSEKELRMKSKTDYRRWHFFNMFYFFIILCCIRRASIYVGLSNSVLYEDVLDKAIENQILFKLPFTIDFSVGSSEFFERHCLY